MSPKSTHRILLAFHFLVTMLGRSIGSHQPLTFDPFSLEIYEPVSLDNHEDDVELTFKLTKEYPLRYALACPPEYEVEMDFDKRYSLDNKSLILQYFIEKGKSMGGLKCEADFKLSIVYHFEKQVEFIEFGYEVYYDEKNFKQNFSTVSYRDFKKIRNTGFTIHQMISSLKWPPTPTIEKFETKPFRLSLKDYGPVNRPMGFIWISKVKLQFDHYTWTVKTVSYKVNAKTHKFKAKCKDSSLGQELYPKPHSLDNFYMETNQKDVFSSTELPTTSPNDCRDRYQCVKKYSLAPSYFFQPAESSPLVCSNLTTIPIWYSTTEKLLNYLEKFISVIALVTNYNVYVTDGTDGILTLPLKDESKKAQPIYLFAAEKKIPIPRIIYKSVIYKTYDCNNPEQNLCWFGVVIVIHNEPEFSDEKRICPTDECERLGWESIQFASTDKNAKHKSEHIYCCSYHGVVQDELDDGEDMAVKGELSLKAFPYYDGKLHRNQFEDRQAEFEGKMKELFPEIGNEWESSFA